MSYILGEKVSTIWIPDHLNPEIKWHIRLLTESKDQEILGQHKVKESIQNESGEPEIIETWKTTHLDYLFDIFDYCLIDWNNQVQDGKGKKVKCTREKKKILFDSDKDAWKWISTNAAIDLNFGDDAQVKKKLLERFNGVFASNGGKTIGEPAAANA